MLLMNLRERIMIDIAGYEGLYSIDKNGDIFGYKKQLFLSTVLKKRGYVGLSLCKDGVSKNHELHRLLALAFIPNPEKKPQVNHINGIKHDNRLENLEWCTAKENVAHALKLGLRETPKGESHCYYGKPAHNRKKIINLMTGAIYESITEASKQLSLRREDIRNCVNRIQKTCGGFVFLYYDDLTPEKAQEAIFIAGFRKSTKRLIKFMRSPRGKAYVGESIINITTGDVFESIADAAEKLNLNKKCIKDCLNGRQKTSGGFKFERVITDGGTP